MTGKSFATILGKQLRTSAGRADTRKKLIGIIQGAAKKRGLVDDDRRAMQLELTGKASLADMTPAELGVVLDHLNKSRPAPMAHRPHVAKVRALWWTLYWLGAVDEPNDHALDAFVQRQTGVAKIAFLGHRQAPSVIEALKAMATREGVRWSSEAQVKALPADTPESVDTAHLDRIAVIDAIWRKLKQMGEARSIWELYVESVSGDRRGPLQWSPRQLDDAIKLVGKKLRRALAKRVVD